MTETFRKTLAVTSRYCLWSAHYAPHPGGIENYTERLARVLADRGNRVVVVTSNLYGGQSVVRQKDGVEVFRLPCRALMNGRLPIPRKNSAYRSLLADLDDIGFDGVLVNARFYGHSLEAMKFARRNGLKPVVLDHGSAYLTLGNVLFDAALAAYEQGVTALGKRYHADYYGVSRASARWLETFGIEALGVLPNAIDAEDFRESSSGRDFRAELGLLPETKLVATVGRVAPEKGMVQLVEAAKLFESDGVAFAIAGDGPLLNELKAKAPENMHFLGSLKGGDVSALLSQASAFCLPSRSEGFCTSLLEASAWGCPSVITHVGGVDELVPDERFGVILPDAKPQTIVEGLAKVLHEANTSEERRRLITAHLENGYGWNSAAESLVEAFDRAATTV